LLGLNVLLVGVVCCRGPEGANEKRPDVFFSAGGAGAVNVKGLETDVAGSFSLSTCSSPSSASLRTRSCTWLDAGVFLGVDVAGVSAGLAAWPNENGDETGLPAGKLGTKPPVDEEDEGVEGFSNENDPTAGGAGILGMEGLNPFVLARGTAAALGIGAPAVLSSASGRPASFAA
jgi:hypothetical protein